MLLSREGFPVSPSFVQSRKVEALPKAGEPEAPAAVNVEHCALFICHVPFAGQVEQAGGRLGILKVCEVAF